jgi:hypothetical protein
MLQIFLLYLVGTALTAALMAYTYRPDPSLYYSEMGRDEFFLIEPLIGLLWPVTLPVLLVVLAIRFGTCMRSK